MKQWISFFCLLAGLAVFLLGGENLIGLYLHGESADVDPAATMHYAKQYLHVMLFGLPPFVVTQVYASSLRETGDSVKPMLAGILSVFVDIIGNYLLIYGNFGMPKLGVQGAAIATVLARVVEMSIVVIWAHARKRKHVFLQGLYRTMRIPADSAKKMIRKGLPIFFNEFLWAGSFDAVLFHPWATDRSRAEHFQCHLQLAERGICCLGLCRWHSDWTDAGCLPV